MFLISDVKWNKTGNSSVLWMFCLNVPKYAEVEMCTEHTRKMWNVKCALSTQENQMWILSRKKSLIFNSEVIYWSLQKSNLIATLNKLCYVETVLHLNGIYTRPSWPQIVTVSSIGPLQNFMCRSSWPEGAKH